MKSLLKLSCLAASVATLTACASLHDVNNKWCPPEVAPVAPVTAAPIITPAPVVEHIELSADALFKFNKSGLNDLLPEGRNKLDELTNQLNQGYVRIEQIRVTGHTDRIGSEQYNQKLGLARATTVRDYLANRGVNTTIEVASAGETQPKTTNCVGTKATPKLIACLQPDRRVEVDIQGTKK